MHACACCIGKIKLLSCICCSKLMIMMVGLGLQGEDQKKLDVLANEVFINVLKRCGQCSVLV